MRARREAVAAAAARAEAPDADESTRWCASAALQRAELEMEAEIMVARDVAEAAADEARAQADAADAAKAELVAVRQEVESEKYARRSAETAADQAS